MGIFLHTTRGIVAFSPVSLLLILIASCASAPPPRQETISPELAPGQTESSEQIKAMNERILRSSIASKEDLYHDYSIGPEDLLEISVFEVEKLSQIVRVSLEGNISLPLLGTLRVKGLTASQLEGEIKGLLAEKYLQDPQVTVFIREHRSQRISVMGAVEKPNVYNVTGPKTILDMLAVAGGLRHDAGYLLFLIRSPQLEGEASKERKDRDQETPETFVIDLEELLLRGNLVLNMPLIHGDVINVPVGGKVFVGGEVRKPGGFPLKGERMTLTQAIVLAGGLKTEAAGASTKIFRHSSKEGDEKEVVSANVYAIEKGNEEDLYLKENDIIIVPRHGFKGFLVEFRETFRSVFSIGYSVIGF
jgi:polysaccharide export outer membrane protein